MDRPVYISATGNVGPADGGSLFAVTLTGGTDAATLLIKEGGASGTQIWALICAAAATTVTVTFPRGVVYTGQLHGTLTGTSPKAGFAVGI